MTRTPIVLHVGFLVALLGATEGCASLSPPFDKMKATIDTEQMTVYRLQNFEPQPVAQNQPAQPQAGGLQLPPQIQQWIQAGASLLPPGLLPPGLIPGAAPTPAPPPQQEPPRFHNFRILEWQPVTDSSVKSDILDTFGKESSFQDTHDNCMYAEFGFAMAQPNNQAPADILVSLSCDQVQAYNFNWPYSKTGVTADSAKKIAAIVQKTFTHH
jgi:hypothetical protein